MRVDDCLVLVRHVRRPFLSRDLFGMALSFSLQSS